MSYNKVYFFFLIVSMFIVQSCTETVDVDVPYDGNRLVVEASIDWKRGTSGQTQIIRLSTTTEYFSDQGNQAVTGAAVMITKDDDGLVFVFTDQGDGSYMTNDFVPELGQSYTLQIEYNGQTYTASETMMPVSNITSVEQTTEEGFSDEDIEVTIHYDDPVDEDNYYMAQFFPSHKPVPTIWAFPDQFSDGNEGMFFYEDADFEPGVAVNITLLGISERYYHYMNLIVLQSSQSFSGPFQATPVQVQGNCINRDNPSEEVLGYFRLCEAIQTEHIIE